MLTADKPNDLTCGRRIHLLVAAHIVLAAVPLLLRRVDLSNAPMLVLWYLRSIPFRSLMMLSVWVGMGRTRLPWRVASGLVSLFYISTVSMFYYPPGDRSAERMLAHLTAMGKLGVIFFLLAGIFMLIGRRYEFLRADHNAETVRNEKFRFLLLPIVIVLPAVAMVSGVRFAVWDLLAISARSAFGAVMLKALYFVDSFVYTACATFVTFGTDKVRRNIAAVALVVIALGVAFAAYADGWARGLAIVSPLIEVIPTLTVFLSFFVVRSCGWRMVRR